MTAIVEPLAPAAPSTTRRNAICLLTGLIVGLLAQAFLEKHPGEKIVHDPRVVLNTRDVIARAGGQAVQARTGHAYLKRAMRAHDAIYGGEMSAHHYFRDFHFADSGMVPWLLVV